MSEGAKGEGTEQPPVQPWERVSEKVMAETAVFDLVARRCRHPQRGTEADFYALKSGDWVNVIPVTDSGEVVLVRQWRFGIEELSWEVPGGIIDAGEDPVQAGLRELVEETGYESREARIIGRVRPNPAIQVNTCYFVAATGVRLTSDQDWDAHEEIEVRRFPVDEVYAMARRGEIVHSLVIDALFFFYPEWEKMKARRRTP